MWTPIPVVCAAAAMWWLVTMTGQAAEPLPKRGDFIAMGGDSITYVSHYSRFVEMYLLATRPDLDLRVMKIQRWCRGKAKDYARGRGGDPPHPVRAAATLPREIACRGGVHR